MLTLITQLEKPRYVPHISLNNVDIVYVTPRTSVAVWKYKTHREPCATQRHAAFSRHDRTLAQRSDLKALGTCLALAANTCSPALI